MSSILWMIWQRCDDGDQDDEMKNSSYQEQVFAWVLGVGLLLCSICMIVFLSLMMVGASWNANAVRNNNNILVEVLPQVRVVCLCGHMHVWMCVCMCVYLLFICIRYSKTDHVTYHWQAESLRDDTITGINNSFVVELEKLLDSINRTYITSRWVILWIPLLDVL